MTRLNGLMPLNFLRKFSISALPQTQEHGRLSEFSQKIRGPR